jgi:hypothetical protein
MKIEEPELILNIGDLIRDKYTGYVFKIISLRIIEMEDNTSKLKSYLIRSKSRKYDGGYYKAYRMLSLSSPMKQYKVITHDPIVVNIKASLNYFEIILKCNLLF